MRSASDFRLLARNALKNKWGIAILAGLIASILGGASSSGGGGINFNFNTNDSSENVQFSLEEYVNSENFQTFLAIFLSVMGIIIVVALVVSLVYLFIGSIVELGYSKFNLKLIDMQEATLNDLFDYFRHWKVAIISRLLRSVYTFLWSLLFIIPGIIASYSYAMTSYILAEHPEMSASEAIEISKKIMDGNKWRFFCLQLSFIGWDLLSIFSCGIGNLFLTPYKQVAYAGFYRDVSHNCPEHIKARLYYIPPYTPEM